MSDDYKPTSEAKEEIFRELARIQEEGLLDPIEIFAPHGFNFHISYSGDCDGARPLPEFRVYAQQFLSLFAVTLISCRDLLPERDTSVRCDLERRDEEFTLVVTTDVPLNVKGLITTLGPLHRVGITFSTALRRLFPGSDKICWDSGRSTGLPKFWLKYPGKMTPAGRSRVIENAPFFAAWRAELRFPYPDQEQERRAVALCDFVLEEPPHGPLFSRKTDSAKATAK